MKLWIDLCEFIHITTIKDGEVYKTKMATFERKLTILVTVGEEYFLTKGAVAGDVEIFYMHCLRCYIPKIAWTTLSNQHLGNGLFTTQGYKCRNRENNLYYHHSNVKGNVQSHTLRRFYDGFIF